MVYYKAFAHMILAATKSQDLQLAIWKPRRASAVSSSRKTSRRKIQGELRFLFEFEGRRKMSVLARCGQAEGVLFPLRGNERPQPFCLFRSSADQMRPTQTGEGSLPFSVTFLQKYPHSQTQNNTNWPSGWAPKAQSS